MKLTTIVLLLRTQLRRPLTARQTTLLATMIPLNQIRSTILTRTPIRSLAPINAFYGLHARFYCHQAKSSSNGTRKTRSSSFTRLAVSATPKQVNGYSMALLRLLKMERPYILISHLRNTLKTQTGTGAPQSFRFTWN